MAKKPTPTIPQQFCYKCKNRNEKIYEMVYTCQLDPGEPQFMTQCEKFKPK